MARCRGPRTAAARRRPAGGRRRRDPVARPAGGRRRSSAAVPCYACLPIPAAGEVTLGFAFARPLDAAGRQTSPARPRPPRSRCPRARDRVDEHRARARGLRAREAERARFVSTVAHELRTPLTGLSGYLDLILDGTVDDAAIEREFLERGRSIVGLDGRARRRPARAVAARVRVARPRASRRSRWPTRSSTVVAGLLPIAMDRGVRSSRRAATRIRTATGDRRRVEQIVTNLARMPSSSAPVGAEVELTGWFDGRSPSSWSATRGRASRPRIAPGSSTASTGWPTTSESPGRASGCRSRATSPGRWVASSTWRASRHWARRSSWSCPVPPAPVVAGGDRRGDRAGRWSRNRRLEALAAGRAVRRRVPRPGRHVDPAGADVARRPSVGRPPPRGSGRLIHKSAPRGVRG